MLRALQEGFKESPGELSALSAVFCAKDVADVDSMSSSATDFTLKGFLYFPLNHGTRKGFPRSRSALVEAFGTSGDVTWF